MSQPIETLLSALRLVPVVRLEELPSASGLADALMAGGLPLAEITLRTPVALSAIEQLANREDILVGAGTVLNRTQAADCIQAGARFVVSPGLDPELVSYCQSRDIPVFPGVSSASEIQAAYNLGLRQVKFFPAEAAGGTASLKALAAPFHQMQFIPTGGISATNLLDYLDLDCTLAVGGSWMVKPALYESGNFSQVTELTRAAVQMAKRQDD
ncbi:MAG: bifunctional 4-hydroxy-2-oxoglutarate aldolase/2-dehydro-3-deoxy-phosphogluconate aldolase [Mariniblastus sp.]|nr:bifunctional 4-hydroxy-2-oxoglutarate aldolase/2-dehydro-3-deoxy-phosphogluconate aldolase [Mariniblastus sp.]